MTQVNKLERLGGLLRAASDKKAKRENKLSKKGELKPYSSYRLGKDAGIDPAYAYKVLHGRSLPSRDVLIRMCKALGCSQEEIAEIFRVSDYWPPDAEELDEARLAMTA